MDPLRYHTEVEVGAETSHALVVELVGRDKRVLDVGCATGALAKVLTARGCVVCGIEPDERAAEVAKQHVSELVVGRLEEIDLEASFGSGGFEAIVVADVLEHMEDPVEALRRLRDLLAPDGCVIASIPNVAHGAVRLALLDGRFEYTDVGLLDRTHLRFFTRVTVEQLLADAGFDIIEMRRTEAGLFATEIRVGAADFDPALVEAIAADPEATTYQFVLRAVPKDRAGDARQLHLEREAVRERIHELEAEVARLRATRAAGIVGRGAQVGLWGFFDTRNPADALRLAIHRSELARRLPSLDLRSMAPFGNTASKVDGVVLEPLGPADREHRQALLEDLDAVIVVGDITARADEMGRRYGDGPAGDDHPARHLVDAIAGEDDPSLARRRPTFEYSGVTVEPDVTRADDRGVVAALAAGDHVATPARELAALVRAAGGDVEEVPDPLLLVDRLYERRRLVAARGAAAPTLDRRYVLIRGGEQLLAPLPRLSAALTCLVEQDPETAIVLVNAEGTPGEGRCTAEIAEQFPGVIQVLDPSPAETVALVAGAAGVATDAAWLLHVAAAFGVPRLSLADADTSPALADRAVLLHLLAGKSDPDDYAPRRLDEYFDALAAGLGSIVTRPRLSVWPPFASRYEATEHALEEHRHAAIVAEEHVTTAQAELAAVRRAADGLESRAAALQQSLIERDDELAAIFASRWWRSRRYARALRKMAPTRHVLARLRAAGRRTPPGVTP
jgi:2-polyprenyl-3-methyl-5-hydroxy-6-metoxy-1,4-benzoquinol methylase